MTIYRTIYITTSTKDEAILIANHLLELKLAACANIFGQATSLYWWEGKINEDQEWLMILKTKASLVDALIQEAKNKHSYDNPCIVSLPIEAGSSDYLKWLNENTKS